jgi:hypothetical protein
LPAPVALLPRGAHLLSELVSGRLPAPVALLLELVSGRLPAPVALLSRRPHLLSELPLALANRAAVLGYKLLQLLVGHLVLLEVRPFIFTSIPAIRGRRSSWRTRTTKTRRRSARRKKSPS